MKTEEKIIYYKDEANDDFANNNINKKPLGKGFKYIHNNFFFKIFEFSLYYIIAFPLVYLIQKIYSHQKFINRKAFKKAKADGYFIYGNHTQLLNDAYVGALATFPKKCFIITHPDATSIKGIRLIVQALGAIPVGENIKETNARVECIEKRMMQKKAILIYPEAHLWPYYTKIRNFPYHSFRYPAMFNKPIFVLTNCYQKRKFSKRPKILTFVDGPFYPNPDLNEIDSAKELRNIAYGTMCSRVREHSTYEYIKYIKEE